MSEYLDSDMLRRSSATILRLTVVAILSLIGTATTGFLGMNLLDEADASLTLKVIYFGVVALLTTMLTVYTIIKANRLAEFLDALSDTRLYWRKKLKAFSPFGKGADRRDGRAHVRAIGRPASTVGKA